jgi:methyltransferase family protein
LIELGTASSPSALQAPTLQNLYACLVHESQECVVDLVRNLRCLDPEASILLYNGSADARLLEPASCFDKLGARVHPQPRPVDARTLHEFALDCMRFATEHLPFDTLTIVDSDQLGLRSGWSALLSNYLAGQQGVGLLGGGIAGRGPERQPKSTRVTPAIGAWQELPAWLPLLRRFPDGESQFPRWAAWPGSVFTSECVRELVRWYDGDAALREVVNQSRVWAKEQIIFPTLTALLGFRLLPSPGSYDYVKYAVAYDPSEAQAALADERAYWIHPVARRYDDPSRSAVRHRFAQYRNLNGSRSAQVARQSIPPVGDELRQPILREMKEIEGWLTRAEADLLIVATHQALRDCPHANALVEVGSFCGRATIVLGSVVRALRSTARVWAIDPHDGFVGAHDCGLERVGPTLPTLKKNIEQARLSPFVEIVQAHAEDVPWSEPLCLLLIDGLHDYPNVLKDFSHFEPHLVDGALVAFHDYAKYFPGVPAFVDELSASGRYETLARAKSLIVLRKLPSEQPPQSS